MTAPTVDVIDHLAGITPDSPLDSLRRRRPVTRAQLQASFDALFAPVDDTAFPVRERALIAAFATRLTGDDPSAAFFAQRARDIDPVRAEIVLAEAAEAAAPGPFGVYREAGLEGESTSGLRYAPSEAVRDAVGDRVAAGLAHAHLLVARPREAADEALDALLDAGWSVDGIVTLAQLVSFLAFQQRVAAGLRALALTTTEVAA